MEIGKWNKPRVFVRAIQRDVEDRYLFFLGEYNRKEGSYTFKAYKKEL